jgi:hypothetical protein
MVGMRLVRSRKSVDFGGMNAEILKAYCEPGGQFELSDDGVFHVASGAMFWVFPECEEPSKIDWGKARDTDRDGRPLFDERFIDDVARALLKYRLAN